MDYVIINGVKWATKNLGASTPEDYGYYYSFDWAEKDCPIGWRLPTDNEFRALIDSGCKRTIKNGKRGHLLGSGNNTIFLPAAGFCNYGDSMGRGGNMDVDDCGYYWTRLSFSQAFSFYLDFNSDGAGGNHGFPCEFGCSVRCVAEN